MSARSNIVDRIVDLLNNELTGMGSYPVNIFGNATKRLLFWDEVTDFPHISVVAGSEQREYLPSRFKWGTLTVSLKIYVQNEDPLEELEDLISYVEKLLDANNEIEYETGKLTQEVRITSIETDEGLLAPHGVGDVTLQILYEVHN